MSRIVQGILLLLLAVLPAPGQDKPREAPDPPSEQYKALIKEYQETQQTFFQALQAAKTDAERTKVMEKRPKPGKFTPRFLELAEKNPKHPIAFDALSWIARQQSEGETTPETAKAFQILLRDHIANEKLGDVCQALSSGIGDAESLAFLRGVRDKNPHKAVQAEASAAIGLSLNMRATIGTMMKKDPEFVDRIKEALGKATVDDLSRTDVPKLQAESEAAFKEFTTRYVSEMKPDRLAQICQTLGFSEGEGPLYLLRTLAEKDERKEVRGVATLALGQLLNTRANNLAEKEPREAEKLRKEAETALDSAAQKYADVKLPFAGTVGESATKELFEVRFLAVGKKAPLTEGEDQDGKKFKLSDYEGKVVLLDFWSEF
jgi:hypothetical protein